ncbi:MAG: hypothetical protein ACIAXF_16225 [Phycisphaerales bacterium JB063]
MSIAARTFIPATALLLSLAMPTLSQAQPYELVFDRPHDVGARYSVAGEAYISQEMHQRVNGDTMQEQSTHSEVNLEGVVDILAVNAAGGVTQLALTVGEYDIEINDIGVELQADRRIIGTVEGDDARFHYENGDAIDDELGELLEMFLDDLLDDEGSAGDADETMNLDGPKSPGDRWEMGHDYMVQSAREDGQIALDPDRIESEVHFVEVNEDNDFGTAMAVIELTMRTEGVTFTGDDFPEWMEMQESYIEMEGSGMLPIDPALHKGRHEVEMEMAFLVAGEVPGQGVQVEIEVEMNRGSTLVLGDAR